MGNGIGLFDKKNSPGAHYTTKHALGERFVLNYVKLANSKFDGIVRSGVYIDLTGTSVDIPSNTGDIVYFDYDLDDVVKASSSHIADVKLGSCVMLWMNTFSAEDMIAFSYDPELLGRWALGEVIIPSGIVFGSQDEFYPVFEGAGDLLIGKNSVVSQSEESTKVFNVDNKIVMEHNKVKDHGYARGSLEPYSGNSVTVSGEDNYIPIPINYTLSSDTKQTATLGADWVDNGGDSYTASNATSALSDLSSTSNVPVLISYTISNYSAGDLEGNSADGDYETVSKNETLNANGFSGDVLINSVKEITQVQGAVGWFNHATKQMEQVGADGIRSKELVVNGDFSDGMTGWRQGQSVDKVYIENEKMVFDHANATETLVQDHVAVVGRTYFISFEISDLINNGAMVRYPYRGIKRYNNGTFTEVKTASETGMLVYPTDNDTSLKIDNISLKEALPLSTTYDLKDGEYSLIYKLHINQFSDDDLILFSNEPEKLLQWYWGEITIPSGIIRTVDDKVYAICEGWDRYLLDLDYSETDLSSNITYSINGTNNTITRNGNVFTVHMENSTSEVWYPNFRTNAPISKLCRVSFDLELLNRDVYLRKFESIQTKTYEKVIDHSSKDSFVFMSDGGGSSAGTLVFDGTQHYVNDFNLTMTYAEVTSDYLTVQGTYSWNVGVNSGLQTLRLELNDAKVPTSAFDNKLKFYGTSDNLGTKNMSLIPSFFIEEVIDGTHYSHRYQSGSLVTWISGIEQAPVSFTPPDKVYQLGYGVYPGTGSSTACEYTRWSIYESFYRYNPVKAYNDWVNNVQKPDSIFSGISTDGVWYVNQDRGPQALCFKTSNFGMILQGRTRNQLSGGSEFTTNWYPNNLSYTIEWNGYLYNYGYEDRVLVHTPIGNKLYMNGVLVDTNPTLPSSSKKLLLDMVPPIGEAEAVEYHINPFRVFKFVIDEQKIRDNAKAFMDANCPNNDTNELFINPSFGCYATGWRAENSLISINNQQVSISSLGVPSNIYQYVNLDAETYIIESTIVSGLGKISVDGVIIADNLQPGTHSYNYEAAVGVHKIEFGTDTTVVIDKCSLVKTVAG